MNVRAINRTFFKSFTVVRHQRAGNTQTWSVTGGTLKRGQVVTTHAMCSENTAILKALKQDESEAVNG